MPLWIWPMVALMIGGYVYAGLTASPLDDQTRYKLRQLGRQGAALDRLQTVRFVFTAPTSDVAHHLQERLQALEFTTTVVSDAAAARAAAAAAETEADADEDREVEAEAEAEVPSDATATPPSPLFDVEGERPMVPTRATLRHHERQLDALARAAGARYDGWRLPGQDYLAPAS